MLTEKEKRFIQNNKADLEELFLKRIQELKENCANLNTDLSAEEFKIHYLGYQNFIKEMEIWLRTIRVLTPPKEKKEDTGV